MKRSAVTRLFALTLVSGTLGALGCSSSSDGSPTNANGAATATPAATTASANLPSDEEIERSCTAYFDGLTARHDRCGTGAPVMHKAAYAGARPSFMAACRQRMKREGTGYTPQFNDQCAKVFTDTACEDVDTVYKACWEPRGTLERGANCATDDQCTDGFCLLPAGAERGSSCGTCAVPIWARDGIECAGKNNVKCLPGLWCSPSPGGTGKCESFSKPTRAGSSCRAGSECADGLGCIGGVCAKATVVGAGESCESESTICAEGLVCSDKVCKKRGGIGEDCLEEFYCVGWTQCSPTNKCELWQQTLDCHAPNPSSTSASTSSQSCKGTASSCSSRAAGTCAGQDGCTFTMHTHADGSYTNTCDGTPTSCSFITTEAACGRQDGCTWQ